MLETVMKWHESRTVFDKECANYPGFVTKFRVSNQVIKKKKEKKMSIINFLLSF